VIHSSAPAPEPVLTPEPAHWMARSPCSCQDQCLVGIPQGQVPHPARNLPGSASTPAHWRQTSSGTSRSPIVTGAGNIPRKIEWVSVPLNQRGHPSYEGRPMRSSARLRHYPEQPQRERWHLHPPLSPPPTPAPALDSTFVLRFQAHTTTPHQRSGQWQVLMHGAQYIVVVCAKTSTSTSSSRKTDTVPVC